MEFRKFNDLLNQHFKEMAKCGQLFFVSVDKDEMWNLYLDSFPAGTNNIFRKRREFDCSCCRHFVKTIGNVVAIKNGRVATVWDFNTGSEVYQPVVDALSAFVKSKEISGLWLCGEKAVGTLMNYEYDDAGKKVTQWDHFHVDVPEFCKKPREYSTIPEAQGRFVDKKNVYKRSLDEITMDAVDTVLELISQNSLYRGQEWKGTLIAFKHEKEAYEKVPDDKKDLWCWERVGGLNPTMAGIRNTSIGTLLDNISKGMDLEAAVRAFETIVAPANYKRPKAIFTKKMLEDAKKTVEELGYMKSLSRRFATLDDITINNILFSNRDAAARMAGNASPFEEMASDMPINPKQFNRVEEISIEKFIQYVLPVARELELFMEAKFRPNIVSLIAPADPESPSMFKWNNGFSWAYAGNLADSDIKTNVKAAGGNVNGVLRFSIQWNDEPGKHDRSDEDAHCQTPIDHIAYFNPSSSDGGSLDVDVRVPKNNVPAVENIVWPNIKRMKDGRYKFYVNCYESRSGNNGFCAEIEANGEVHRYECRKKLRTGQDVQVAEVILKNGQFTILDKMDSDVSSVDVCGVKTNQFVPVSVAMYSPNYWDGQNGIGNRHYFFMLKGCVNDETPNGFYNEFLKEELLKHKRVFEALGSKMSVQMVDDQLTGVGFSSTIHNEFIVRVKGATDRVLKVKI